MDGDAESLSQLLAELALTSAFVRALDTQELTNLVQQPQTVALPLGHVAADQNLFSPDAHFLVLGGRLLLRDIRTRATRIVEPGETLATAELMAARAMVDCLLLRVLRPALPHLPHLAR
jgi:hypothetical protein